MNGHTVPLLVLGAALAVIGGMVGYFVQAWWSRRIRRSDIDKQCTEILQWVGFCIGGIADVHLATGVVLPDQINEAMEALSQRDITWGPDFVLLSEPRRRQVKQVIVPLRLRLPTVSYLLQRRMTSSGEQIPKWDERLRHETQAVKEIADRARALAPPLMGAAGE